MISVKTTASCGRYERKSGKMRRRLALRTAGSAGRSGRSSCLCSKAATGHLPRVPAAASVQAGCGVRRTSRLGAERLDRDLQPVGQLARKLGRRLRPRDRDRLADQRSERRERDRPGARVPSACRGAAPAGAAPPSRAPSGPRRGARGPRAPHRPRGRCRPPRRPRAPRSLTAIAAMSLPPRCTGIASTVPSHQRRPGTFHSSALPR